MAKTIPAKILWSKKHGQIKEAQAWPFGDGYGHIELVRVKWYLNRKKQWLGRYWAQGFYLHEDGLYATDMRYDKQAILYPRERFGNELASLYEHILCNNGD